MTLGQKVLRFFQTRLVRVAILLASLLVATSIVRSVVVIWQKRGIVEERKVILDAELTKQRELERQLQEATSSAFIERVAREKLGLVREGETVVIIDKTKIQNADSKTISTSDVPSWKQWWQLFF